MVITIQIWYGLTRFRIDFSVSTPIRRTAVGMTVSQHHGRRSPLKPLEYYGNMVFRCLRCLSIEPPLCREAWASMSVNVNFWRVELALAVSMSTISLLLFYKRHIPWISSSTASTNSKEKFLRWIWLCWYWFVVWYISAGICGLKTVAE